MGLGLEILLNSNNKEDVTLAMGIIENDNDTILNENLLDLGKWQIHPIKYFMKLNKPEDFWVVKYKIHQYNTFYTRHITRLKI